MQLFSEPLSGCRLLASLQNNSRGSEELLNHPQIHITKGPASFSPIFSYIFKVEYHSISDMTQRSRIRIYEFAD